MISETVEYCKYCGYEGLTDYYRGKHHCMKCNRLIENE